MWTKTRALLALAATGLIATQLAEARITRIEITTTESPTFGGFSWPGVGQYEKLVGRAFGEVNPADPKNAVIVDIALAPRNARGNVEYSFDFYILKPIDLAKGAHKVMYEPPNRGRKTWNTFGRVPAGNDPGSITDPAVLGDAFLMPRGYTMVWSGWDASAGNNGANFNTRIGGPAGPHTLLGGPPHLPNPPFARNCLIPSPQHGAGSATSRCNCQQFQNPLDSAPIQRALF